jgi:hypothetical protein
VTGAALLQGKPSFEEIPMGIDPALVAHRVEPVRATQGE